MFNVVGSCPFHFLHESTYSLYSRLLFSFFLHISSLSVSFSFIPFFDVVSLSPVRLLSTSLLRVCRQWTLDHLNSSPLLCPPSLLYLFLTPSLSLSQSYSTTMTKKVFWCLPH